MRWNSEQMMQAIESHFERFPDSDWGIEGCGLSADEAYTLIEKSWETGIDHLEASYPEYESDAIIA